MLTLTRKEGESMMIGDVIKITLIGKEGDQVYLGIVAQTPSAPGTPEPPGAWRNFLRMMRRKMQNMKSNTDKQLLNDEPSALQLACHRAAKAHAGGAKAIAQQHGLNANTFQNKLNPAEPGCINLKEFEAILKTTRSQLIVEALADLLK